MMKIVYLKRAVSTIFSVKTWGILIMSRNKIKMFAIIISQNNKKK